MKIKLKIITVCLIAAIAILGVSTLHYSIAYFSDRSTGWTETYRLPNVSYQTNIFYSDESLVKDLNTEKAEEFIVKIKNTGNIDMSLRCDYSFAFSSTTHNETILVKAGEEASLTYVIDSNSMSDFTDVTTLSKAIFVTITPKYMYDTDNVAYPFEGESTELYLYAE